MKKGKSNNWDWLVKVNDDGTHTKLWPARYRRMKLWHCGEVVNMWMNPSYSFGEMAKYSNPWGVDMRIRNGSDPSLVNPKIFR